MIRATPKLHKSNTTAETSSEVLPQARAGSHPNGKAPVREPIFNAVGVYGGGPMARSGAEKLAGSKRLKQGACSQTAELILKNALQTPFGATGVAAEIPHFVKASSTQGRAEPQAALAAPVRDTIFEAAGVYASARMARNGADKLLGSKRLYHGTCPDAAELIRKNGLQAQLGGTGAAAAHPSFVAASSNKCHVTTQRLVAKLFEKQRDPHNPLNLLDEHGRGAVFRETAKSMISRGGRGFVKIHLPYEHFAHMKKDPDVPFGYTTEKNIESAYVRDGPKNILSRVLKLSRLYPNYARQFPQRIAGGVVQTTAALIIGRYFSTKLCERWQEEN